MKNELLILSGRTLKHPGRFGKPSTTIFPEKSGASSEFTYFDAFMQVWHTIDTDEIFFIINTGINKMYNERGCFHGYIF